MPSKVPDVIDYLVTLFTDAATIGGTGVAVVDGPKVQATTIPLGLWVGCDDITATLPAAASSTQELGGLKPRATERLSINCTAYAWSGGDDVATLRTAAYGVVAAVETTIAGDPALGGTVASRPAVTGAQLRQGPQNRGMAAQVTFTIDATALTEP